MTESLQNGGSAEVISRILEERIIAVVRTSTPDEAVQVGFALARAGVRLIEITFTVPDAPRAIERISNELVGVVVGAGSVTNMDQVQAAINAGAQFVVSPVLFTEMIPLCRRQGVVSIVAGLTPTELFVGWRRGADFVKLFPAGEMGGPSYVRGVLGPLPELPLVPTGGITLDNFLDYLRVGAKAVGMGGSLVPGALVKARDWDALTAHAKKFVEALRGEA